MRYTELDSIKCQNESLRQQNSKLIDDLRYCKVRISMMCGDKLTKGDTCVADAVIERADSSNKIKLLREALTDITKSYVEVCNAYDDEFDNSRTAEQEDEVIASRKALAATENSHE